MKKVLVTGGGGFVGTALVTSLVERGIEVVVAGRNSYPHIERLGVKCFRGDIRLREFTDIICKEVDTVFHSAAKAGIWGAWRDYEATNVLGTKNIVDSCRACNIKRLIYTSTPSVVFSARDIVNGDETLWYAKRPLCHYAKSKILAERYLLKNNSDTMKTVAIRPHLIWGPGDPHLVPRLLEKGRRQELKIVGSGTNKVDITYIDNVAHAHLLAADNLNGSCEAAGKAYFIGQEQPVNLWDWINTLYRDLEIPEIKAKVPFKTAYIAGTLLELIHTLLRRENEPRMTRFLALQLARSHFFSHQGAFRDFGYKPIVSLDEGQEKLLKWLKDNDI